MEKVSQDSSPATRKLNTISRCCISSENEKGQGQKLNNFQTFSSFLSSQSCHSKEKQKSSFILSSIFKMKITNQHKQIIKLISGDTLKIRVDSWSSPEIEIEDATTKDSICVHVDRSFLEGVLISTINDLRYSKGEANQLFLKSIAEASNKIISDWIGEDLEKSRKAEELKANEWEE